MKLSKLEIENLLKEKSERLKLNKVNSKSEVWLKFYQIEYENVNFVVCKDCDEVYAFKYNSTSTMSRHKCKVINNNQIINFLTKKSIET